LGAISQALKGVATATSVALGKVPAGLGDLLADRRGQGLIG
jgi:hypothetical protein